MKTRIISGVIGAALMVVILFVLPAWALNIAAAALAVMAVWETLTATGIMSHKGVLASCLVYAAVTPFFYLFTIQLLLPATVLLAAVLCVLQVMHHAQLKVEKVGFTFFMTVVIAFAFSAIGNLRQQDNGLLYVLMTMVIPWMSDTGAYFVGTLCGKHKLCPNISPKKTVEGLVGGVVISLGSTMLLAWLYQQWALPNDMAILWLRVVLVTICLAPISVLGDLFASIIKRQTGIKDYGHIMPGHGGVMDRFDSVLPTASLLYVLVLYCPLIEQVIHCK